MQDVLRENLAEVKKRIAQAAQRCGRSADDVKLIAVSKTHSSEVLQAAMESGATVFGENKVQEAADLLGKIAVDYPNDREVQRQLGQTLYRLGRYDEARQSFLTINRIDPTDAGAYQFLSPLFANLGLSKESEAAQKNYLLWRDDPLADVVANRFYTAHPEWADVFSG